MKRAFLVLWYAVGAGLAFGSVQTVIGAMHSRPHPDPHAMVLGGLEAVSSVLFLVPRTFRVGGYGLLLILLVAFLAHSTMGHFRWDLVIYGSAVSFILAHGPVSVLPSRPRIHAEPEPGR